MTAPGSLVPERGYPPADQGLLVVWGLLASAPFGGMTWQVLHHLAGFRRLGFDVWYVEDADVIIEPGTLDYASDPEPNIAFLARWMAEIGLEDRWLFRVRHLDTGWRGNGGETEVRRLYADADAVFNLCGNRVAAEWEDPLPANLVYLETDPGDMQIAVARGDSDAATHLARHCQRYTYGVNVGAADFPVPIGDLSWLPTRPPVVADWWRSEDPPTRPFSTIAQWRVATKPPLVWEDFRFEWRKDILFERVIDLPRMTSVPIELALRGARPEERDRLRDHGWNVSSAGELDAPDAYREFIRTSRGEFTIAKDQYTKLRTGWFSDRSVCYLAAGRPVVTQSTGFEDHIPTGLGLFAFDDADGAAAALDAIAADWSRHAAAALEIAREHFAHDRVLPGLLAEGAACG